MIISLAVVISFAWLYCVYLFLGPWINTFSFPVFYIWIFGNTAQLLFLHWRFPRADKKQKISKALIKLVWFPAVLGISVVILFVCSFLASEFTKPAKELYLIPAGFSGNFRVVYGEKCGINPSIESGRRVLQIPPNGLLIIRPKFQSGEIDNTYYSVDSNGRRTKINARYEYSDSSSNSPGVLLTGSGNMPGAMADGGYSSESSLTINFTDFTVWAKGGTATSRDEKPDFGTRVLDSLTERLVNACTLDDPRHKD